MEERLVYIITLFRIKLQAYLILNNVDISTNFVSPDPNSKFPKDCCKGTSWILGIFLEEEYGIKDLLYVWGINDQGNSHGWLELNGLIIDLTANQFSGDYPEVLILEKTKSQFHSGFKNQERYSINASNHHMFLEIKNVIAKQFKCI